MLWYFLVQVFVFTSAFSKALTGNETDKLSLLEFKAQVIDSLGALNSWNESVHFCQWLGVTCGRRHQRVTEINIISSQLGGYLSPHIGNLSFLRILYLQNNSFSHEIPEEIGRLFRLRSIRLTYNSFSGKVPANISRCSNLQHIFLEYNNLTGEIPKGMGSFSTLMVIALAGNKFYGEIPRSIANLSNTLDTFVVESNELHGSIPNSFGGLKRLKYLFLAFNNLSGVIPPSVYNLSSLQVFSVQMNRLEGGLPPNLGLLLPKLETFLFHLNQFSGAVPVMSNSSNLVDFQILSNHFTGKVPDFSNVPNLNNLVLDANNLGEGGDADLNFLFSLVNLTKLEVLGISQNNFGGVLPECISNFSTKLWRMTFGWNSIKGSIPSGIGYMFNLEVLGFQYNQLVGPIPSNLGQLQNLYSLHLINNKLSGIIPSSLGNATSLSILSLGSNNLQGSLPSSLAECRNLRALGLFQNNLSGQIPKEVIGLLSLTIGLDLSQNYFTGSIPNEVGKLVHLTQLDISENKLSGEIPKTLGSCQSLEYLSLGGNLLYGTIPPSLDSLKGIVEIDFSRNNLSGKIPNFLGGFQLQNLNLSFNNFEGEVPIQGVFKNKSAFSIVGNTRLCGGKPQLSLPKCPSKLDKKQKLSSKKKLIVSLACGLVAILFLALALTLLCRRRKRKCESILGASFGISFLEVSYGDLLKATDGFSSINLIGAGSIWSVYKGVLNDMVKLIVAVKVFNLQTSRALNSFIAECEVLKSIKHRNLVKLLTACSSIDFQGNDFKALVYEYMINGSLEEWLHPSHPVISSEQGNRNFNLIQRLNIVIDVANALDYLHNHCHVPVVHSDLKPSNILLDGDMVAHVGDFGLARFLRDPSRPFSSHHSSSIGLRGSIGYIAPGNSVIVCLYKWVFLSDLLFCGG
ncbi:Serine/threonine protein kinase [Parasponia andersonii]|uniref:non-specific serine/threonine protein kinase n=1 Tax=Parasponia andersonii TaxID=3476 RepID=A0A2P5AJI6_PARAD|nr:Serine/threonine protein kinase [Parasponia andersonii]